MTTSVSTRPPGTLNPTRQQLDELDALLQRMLELPVNKHEDTAPAAVEEPADEPPLPAADLDEQATDADWSSAPQPEDADWSSAPQPEDADWSSPHPPAEPDPSPVPEGILRDLPSVSYMVIETASPRPLPPASGFEPRPLDRKPRLVPVTPTSETPPLPQDKTIETPLPPGPTQESPRPAEEGDTWVPLRSTWQPSAQTWPPLADSWHQAHSGLPAPEAMPSPAPSPCPDPSPLPLQLDAADLPPPQTESASVTPAAATPPRLSLSAEDAPPAAGPAVLLPLLWFNQGFDACLAPLGAPGRWLCGPRGRQVLGVIGLTCLAAAVAVALSTMGWTWWASLIK